jgi:hypothetical protein
MVAPGKAMRPNLGAVASGQHRLQTLCHRPIHLQSPRKATNDVTQARNQVNF